MTGGDRAAELVSRLRTVWPEPASLSAGRRAGRQPGQSYLVLPSLRRPVLLVPADDAAAAMAIRRGYDGRRAWFVLQALAWAQQRRLLRFLPWARLRVGDPAASAVVAVVRAAVPATTSMVVRLGQRRHGRAVVLQALAGDGRALAFAKCASGPRADRLRQEHTRLLEVGATPAPGVRAPRVLDFSDAEGTVALVLEALVPRTPAIGRGAPVAAMRGVARSAGVSWRPLAATSVVARLRSSLGTLEDAEARTWLRHELHRLLEEFGDIVVPTGSWHGDWVGWNMARDGDTVLLWDWEHAEAGIPLGLDHVHYLAQDLRVRVGTSPYVEDRWLAAARAAMREDWGVDGAPAEAILRTYLVVINVRYVEDRQGDPDGPSRREGWSRELLARLGDTHDAAWAT